MIQNKISNDNVELEKNLSLADRIMKIIRGIVKEEVNLDDKLNIDSIAFIRLIVTLETEFDIEFDSGDLLITNYTNYRHFVDYVISKIEVIVDYL